MQAIKRELSKHLKFVYLQKELRDHVAAYPDYTFVEDLILQKGRIWLPSDLKFIPLLLQEFHSSPTGGHMGITKTLARLQESFTWQTIRKGVHQFVTHCCDCQHTKYEPTKLLEPFLISARSWEDLSLDFIVRLPSYKGNTAILVMVDKFPKVFTWGCYLLIIQHILSSFYLCTLLQNTMACPEVWYRIKILCSLENFGKSCSNYLA